MPKSKQRSSFIIMARVPNPANGLLRVEREEIHAVTVQEALSQSKFPQETILLIRHRTFVPNVVWSQL